jgi:L-arabinose isomerase
MPWLDAGAPTFAVGRFKAGEAVFVDLAPGPDDTFTLIVVPVKIQAVEGTDRMSDSVRGWFQPPMPVAEFLAEYSMTGGTHHAALVYGEVSEDLIRFGELMDWNVVFLG